MFSIKLFKKYCSSEWRLIFDANKKELQIKAKERIFSEGDKVSGIYFIEKGKVKVLSWFNEKEEKIIRLASDGMILGHRALHVSKYPISAEALTDCTLTYLPKDIFIKILKANPLLSIYLINFLSDELLDTEKRMKNLLILDPKKRLAIVLLKLIDCFGYAQKGSTLLAFTISRADIANIMGTTYETVIRALASLEDQKVIILDGKKIAIKNETALRVIANDISSNRKKNSMLRKEKKPNPSKKN